MITKADLGAVGLSAATSSVTEQEWTKANYFAVLTMRSHCELKELSKIRITEDAAQTYKNLKARYEGKTVTGLRVLLSSITKHEYDDRTQTVEEHIENTWDFMRTVLLTGECSKQVFGSSLKKISWDELLLTLPRFYNTLVENLRTNETYTCGDIVRQRILYVPGRQQGRRREGESE